MGVTLISGVEKMSLPKFSFASKFWYDL